MITRQKTVAVKAQISTPEAEEGLAPTGEFEALVSAFGVTDSYGDVVEPGAFTRSIHEWALKPGPIPVVWSHQFSDPDNIIGHFTHAEETEQGLVLRGVLDLAHPRAARVHDLMIRKIITEFSWSGEVREYEYLDTDDGWWPAMRILDVDLWEAGPCFKGANPETELFSIKSDGSVGGILRERGFAAKAGRVLSQANKDALKEAKALIDSVLATAGEEEPDDPTNEEESDGDAAGEDTGKAVPAPEAAKAETGAPTGVTLDPNIRAALELATITN